MFMVNQSPWRLMGETDSAYVMLLSLSVVIGSQENSARQHDRSTHTSVFQLLGAMNKLGPRQFSL